MKSGNIIALIFFLALSVLAGCDSVKSQESSNINSQVNEGLTAIALTPSMIPTLEQSSIQKQISNGVEFTTSNIYTDKNGDVLADICYTLSGIGVWDINQATIKYINGESSNFEFQETSRKIADTPTGKSERCATIKFSWLPNGATLSSVTLEIHAIALANPQEGHECDEFNVRQQIHEKELSALGLVLSCESSTGQVQMKIVNKPSQMSDEEAQKHIAKYIYGWIDGNWVFTGSVKSN